MYLAGLDVDDIREAQFLRIMRDKTLNLRERGIIALLHSRAKAGLPATTFKELRAEGVIKTNTLLQCMTKLIHKGLVYETSEQVYRLNLLNY